MPNVANIGANPVLFREKGGAIVEILPGTAAPVDLDKTDPRLVAYENARLITMGGTKAQAEKVAREKALVPAPEDAPAAEKAPLTE